MFLARVYQILVASPSDVSKERAAAANVLADWNASHSLATGTVLLPLRWEIDAVPEMGHGAQAVLNRQLVKNADLLVAIFWTRLGTPTERAESGTVEEINEHLAAGKPAMLYFSDAPLPENIPEVPSQLEAVRAFRARCQAAGLVQAYRSVSDFRRHFTRQLAKGLHTWLPEAAIPLEPAPDARRDRRIATLSAEAEDLLETAVADDDGEIRVIAFDGGKAIMSSGRDFTGDRPRREVVQWEAALQELITSGLVQDDGGNGHVYAVTKAGYETHDAIRPRDDA